MDVGARIAAWRKSKNWTQQQLAASLELTVAAIYQWETGRTKPSVEHLEKIAGLLGLTMERFYGRVPKGRAA